MQTFEFALCTEIWFEVLSQANIVSKHLQKVDIDLTTAVALIDGFLEWLRNFCKNGFQHCLDNAKDVVRQCNEDQRDIPVGFKSS